MILSSCRRIPKCSFSQRAQLVNNVRWLTDESREGRESEINIPSVSDDECFSDGLPLSSSSVERGECCPSALVSGLDQYVIGQGDAKRAIAIAMRNRWRRQQLHPDLRKEVTPRNVLMIGPTGCGKTEIVRRTAALGDAPFIKVEATKFTEVGYFGRSVHEIIQDLVDVAISRSKRSLREKLRDQAMQLVEDRILNILVDNNEKIERKEDLRDLYREGSLDDLTIFADVPISHESGPLIIIPLLQRLNIASTDLDFRSLMENSTKKKKIPISQARQVMLELELSKLSDDVDITKEAIAAVEQSGIVVIDEIDKICASTGYTCKTGSDVGVQQDLLAVVEGTTVRTTHGNVNTDYILFIACGAFHSVKPSDMIPELQGRFPIRVELKALSEDDLYRILTEPVNNMILQQIELIGAEGVVLEIKDEAIREMARMAAMLNKSIENIGARRLHTVIERVMEEISFEAAEKEAGTVVTVDKELVLNRLSEMATKTDLSRYML